MSKGDKKFKRTTHFIQRGFQTRMIVKSVSLLAVMALLSSAILYVFAGSELKANYYEAHASIESLWGSLFPVVLITNLASFVVIAIATVFVILYISHKIAGPLHKLESSIDEISTGNLGLRIELRKGDQIKALAGAVNNMIDAFAERIGAIREVSRKMSGLEQRMLILGKERVVSTEELDEIHDQLKEYTARLDSELGRFHLQRV